MSSAGLAREYTRLIARLCAQEPRSGYCHQSQIGPLTGPEMASVLESDENLLAEAGNSRALNTALVNILAENAYSTLERAALVGAAVIGVLTAHCRQALLGAVQEALAKDEAIQRADTADERYLASMSAAVRKVWFP